MKALFYGGAISSLAGLMMGMGMHLPAEQPQSDPYIQPMSDLGVADASAESASYGPSVDQLPPAYVINTAYSAGPAYDLRPEVVAQPVADVTYEDKPADRVLKSAWTDAPEASPQEVAAAGDTSKAAPKPETQVQAKAQTFASIDAALAASQGGQTGPS